MTESKETINSILKINDNENILQQFSDIADKLMHYFCIRCGEKEYRFAEIEFYYYDKQHHHEEWNKKTYPRTNKSAGKLFFHYSGVDICFDSSYDNGRFGGILIRSLAEINDNITQRYINGPLLCANEIMNSCAENREWPEIVNTDYWMCQIETTSRYGISYKNNIFIDKLCFYDKAMRQKTTNKLANATWNYDKAIPQDTTRYYAKRFEQ